MRNIDHIERHADGGTTSADNLQGLCERCNQAKEALGWRARPGPDGSIITITPTGHTYISPPPGTWPPDPRSLSPAERRLRRVLHTHRLAA
ncbi:HNH endonuclease [Nocardioides sp. YIM B13467]|uniref:HNH endonuclease n=1 Tax=Nocardioides sp. YIM B13467 TaxID=3366294 RepID=UPI00366C52D2